jgi:hypothetical protein
MVKQPASGQAVQRHYDPSVMNFSLDTASHPRKIKSSKFQLSESQIFQRENRKFVKDVRLPNINYKTQEHAKESAQALVNSPLI